MNIKMESDLKQMQTEVKTDLRDVQLKEEAQWESQDDLNVDSSCRADKERPFQCSSCGKCFAQRQNLTKHERIHTGERPYRCTLCEKSFVQKQHLTKHQRLHTGERPYCCEICGRGFSCKHNLITHQRIHTGEKPYPCTLCGKTFTRSGNLRAHQRSHKKQGIPEVKPEYQVSFEGQETIHAEMMATPESCIRDQENYTSEAMVNQEFGLSARPFICPQCGKRFANKMVFVNHYRMHTGQRPFHCPQCNQRFVQKQHLTKHLRVHTGERPYSCSHCGKSFSTRYNLLSHQKIHTGEKPYICLDCGKRFMHRSTYRFHKKINSKCLPQTLHNYTLDCKGSSESTETGLNHTIVPLRLSYGCRAFRCNICAKSFSYRHNLINHLRIHTGERPFPCQICGMKFIQKPHLTKHLRLHTGEKPYTCLQCGKSFTIKHNLTTHQRTHTGEKPFTCTECGKAFSRKGILKNHQRTHKAIPATDMKGLSATINNALLGECKNSTLQDSMQVHLDHVCSVCGLHFADNISLQVHEASHDDKGKQEPVQQQNQLHGEELQAGGINGKTFLKEQVLIPNPVVLIGEKPYTGDLCNLVIYKISHNKETDNPNETEIAQQTRVQAMLTNSASTQEPPKTQNTGSPGTNPPHYPNKCKVCGKIFRRRGSLMRHLMIHSGDRPYSCQECGKRFTQRPHLNKHLRLHTGEKPYACLECGHCFSLKHNLITHQRTHTGEKPYTCFHCGKGFSRRSILCTHIKIHSLEVSSTPSIEENQYLPDGKSDHIDVPCTK